MLLFTTINHQFRKANKLSLNEYCLADMVYHLSVNPESKIKGWCYMKRDSMADELGVSKQAVLGIIDRLITKGFVIKDDETKYLQTTKIWNEMYFTGGKESLPEVKKVYKLGKESLPKLGKESLPYNNIDNNNIDNNNIKEKKENDFNSELKKYSEKYSEKILSDFKAYWTEKNKKGKMRFEDQKFFDFKRRLDTWASNDKKFNKSETKNGYNYQKEIKPGNLF